METKEKAPEVQGTKGGNIFAETQRKDTQNFNVFKGINAEFAKFNPLPEVPTITPIDEILETLLNDIQKVDFNELANPEIIELKEKYNNETDPEKQKDNLKKINDCKTAEKEKYVIIIDKILEYANLNNWDICQSGNDVFVFNGGFWESLNSKKLQDFLGKCAERLGLKKTKAKQYDVKDCLLKQFYSSGFMDRAKSDKILINLKNGTFEVENGKHKLRNVDKNDFLTYQLNFNFDTKAKCPKFDNFLNEVLPDVSVQNVLAEFMGYIFIPNLKLEKALFLYGGGANGKSVFFDVVTALLGKENIINNSLSILCEKDDYRARLQNKLVNYASEVGTKINSDIFKQMSSGETLTVRNLYGKPFEIENYARLIFNANTLPKDTEQTNAYFRRFLIIPFDVTIAENIQNPNLAKEIIENELAGVFNWILQGLDRLVKNQKFSECKKADEVRKNYQLQSDSVLMFINENDFMPSVNEKLLFKELYQNYKTYCFDSGCRTCSNRTFADRLRNQNFETLKIGGDMYIYIEIKQGNAQIAYNQCDNKTLSY